LFVTKQVVESIKGAKIISYRSKLAASASSSAPPASAAEYAPPTAPASASVPASAAVPTSAAPSKLHLYIAEKVTVITFILMDPLEFLFQSFWVSFVVLMWTFSIFVIFQNEIA
jgi:hypothetical protein